MGESARREALVVVVVYASSCDIARAFSVDSPVVDVVCPRCRAHARVLLLPDRVRRLVCDRCPHMVTATRGRGGWGSPVDPFLGEPLWLRADHRGDPPGWSGRGRAPLSGQAARVDHLR